MSDLAAKVASLCERVLGNSKGTPQEQLRRIEKKLKRQSRRIDRHEKKEEILARLAEVGQKTLITGDESEIEAMRKEHV